MRDALIRIDQKFKRQPGFSLFYGITSDGLVVGVRKGCSPDGFSPDYFKAMAVDTNLPADQIEQQMVEASFSIMSVDTFRDGGTTIFPGNRSYPALTELSKMSDGEIKAKLTSDESMLSLVTFYKQTGGFYFPTPEDPGLRPTVGGKTVYPSEEPGGRLSVGGKTVYPLNL